jgi:beta-glucosidase/6-phospho-beta-glucosidase/beta-galactosidase
MNSRLFRSFFLAGFECAGQQLRGPERRLDLTRSTAHDRFAATDFALCVEFGLRAARDGFRWPLIESRPGRYDWSTARAALAAAEASGVEVIWDLCHYGVPAGMDIWSLRFVERFAAYAREAALLVRNESAMKLRFCPINEISFWSWAGGDVAYMGPFERQKGPALKRQLVRATIAAIDAIRLVDPQAEIVSAEPAIRVRAQPQHPEQIEQAAAMERAQFEATDMILGLSAPELGGRASLIDIIGINFYPHNQWFPGGAAIPLGSYAYRPFREILADWAQRYSLPVLIAETGAEGSARAAWLHYMCDEARAASEAGHLVVGLCLYPILDYPGWDDDRLCPAGLFGMPDEVGRRRVDGPFAAELRRQQALLAEFGG